MAAVRTSIPDDETFEVFRADSAAFRRGESDSCDYYAAVRNAKRKSRKIPKITISIAIFRRVESDSVDYCAVIRNCGDVLVHSAHVR